MRLHVKLKEFLSMFFMAILFFPAFNASLFFTGVKPLYSIIKCLSLIHISEPTRRTLTHLVCRLLLEKKKKKKKK